MGLDIVAPNVSSVPVYSPFRYPGGKSRLYPFMIKWLKSQDPSRTKCLVEPFAGAAHIGIATAIEFLAKQVILIEIDQDIACVWKTILGDDCHWFVEQIRSFHLTNESASEVLSTEYRDTKRHAFKVFLRNRLSRGGISAPGSGMLERGENGRGIRSRWYPETLATRVEKIYKVRNSILFLEGDGLSYVNQWSYDKSKLFFIDPPYPKAGRRLYKHFDISPQHVFDAVANLSNNFVMTYDDSPDIVELAMSHNWEIRRVLMYTAHHKNKYELFIGRDLGWLSH